MAFVELPPINLHKFIREHGQWRRRERAESEHVPLFVEQEDGSTSFEEGVGGGETGETTANDDRAVAAHLELCAC